MRIDLHTHSSVSDGTDTPTRLVLKALGLGLDVIGLCDHDTFDGIPEAVEAGKRVGLTVLGGIEMSTKFKGESVHLLGYGCDPYHRPLVEELARIRVGRSGRIEPSVKALNEAGLELSVDDVMDAAQGAPSIGRPHLADALVAKGYVANRDAAFAEWLAEGRPGYVERYATPLPDAIDLIHDAKGAAIIAHPWARHTEQILTAPVLEQLRNEHGLEGIEVDHEDHDADTRSLLFDMGARLGMIRTGSSDYHGLGKEGFELGCNLTRKSAYLELLSRIRARGGVLPG